MGRRQAWASSDRSGAGVGALDSARLAAPHCMYRSTSLAGPPARATGPPLRAPSLADTKSTPTRWRRPALNRPVRLRLVRHRRTGAMSDLDLQPRFTRSSGRTPTARLAVNAGSGVRGCGPPPGGATPRRAPARSADLRLTAGARRGSSAIGPTGHAPVCHAGCNERSTQGVGSSARRGPADGGVLHQPWGRRFRGGTHALGQLARPGRHRVRPRPVRRGRRRRQHHRRQRARTRRGVDRGNGRRHPVRPGARPSSELPQDRDSPLALYCRGG